MTSLPFEPSLPFSEPLFHYADGKGAIATFRRNHKYRYELGRCWSPSDNYRRVIFVMLNPSTAGAYNDDATIRRCKGFARDWGYEGIYVVNLFAYIATKPSELRKVHDPVGADNHIFLRWAFEEAEKERAPMVFAWGAVTDDVSLTRVQEISELAKKHNVKPQCLGRAQNGMPLHPLRLAKTTPLIEWGTL